MNRERVDQIVSAVLYEGYILYPYRPSSKKNQRERFTFGRVYPRDYSVSQDGREPCMSQTQCLVRTSCKDANLEVTFRFLQPCSRQIEKLTTPVTSLADVTATERVPDLNIDGTLYQSWLEAIERELTHSISLNPPIYKSHAFAFPAECSRDSIRNFRGEIVGLITRSAEMVRGRVELVAEIAAPGLVKITTRILNETRHDVSAPDPGILMHTFASTHAILHVSSGEFLSLLDPEPETAAIAQACQNIGTWPVLVGESGERDAMLSSPIILYDYPQLAPESAGDLFDGTEIDEILTLRIQTMTDAEKLEMATVDAKARQILQRSENLQPEEFLRMHSTLREVRPIPAETSEDFFNPSSRREEACVNGVTLKAGDRVRIRPKRRADVMDLAMDGKVALIESVQEDVENHILFALVLEDDPGRELGLQRFVGHRFFYSADEVEPIGE